MLCLTVKQLVYMCARTKSRWKKRAASQNSILFLH